MQSDAIYVIKDYTANIWCTAVASKKAKETDRTFDVPVNRPVKSPAHRAARKKYRMQILKNYRNDFESGRLTENVTTANSILNPKLKFL